MKCPRCGSMDIRTDNNHVRCYMCGRTPGQVLIMGDDEAAIQELYDRQVEDARAAVAGMAANVLGKEICLRCGQEFVKRSATQQICPACRCTPRLEGKARNERIRRLFDTDKFRALILASGQSQWALEKETGVSTGTFCRYLAGVITPTRKSAEGIARYFGVPLADIYREEVYILERKQAAGHRTAYLRLKEQAA